MKNLEELELAVESLTNDDYSEFRKWFLEHDREKWDRQSEADSTAGKLDFLVREVQQAQDNI